MKWTTSLLVLLCCAVLVGGAFAKEQSVYFNIGLAAADADYPDYLNELLDAVADLPEVDHIQVGIDIGLYFPMSPGSVLGPAISGIADRYEVGSNHFQLNQYLFAASFRHYFSKSVGKGFFLRGDVGMARMVLDASGLGDTASDSGFGFLAGGGYSFQIGGGTWFSINADFTSKTIEDETVGGTTVGGAFLF